MTVLKSPGLGGTTSVWAVNCQKIDDSNITKLIRITRFCFNKDLYIFLIFNNFRRGLITVVILKNY